MALKHQGFDVSVVLPSDPLDDQLQAKIVTIDGRDRLMAVTAPDADVVVLQRPLRRVILDAIPRLQKEGVKVIVEIDDDFSSIDPRNAAFWACQPSPGVYVYPDGTEKPTGGPDRNWHNVAAACRIADLVTVTTPALAKRYGAHGRVAVLPNYVPESYLSINAAPHEGVAVGWAGSVHSHPGDLQVAGIGVAQAVNESGASFVVVGPGNMVAQSLHLREEPSSTGYLPLWDYPMAVANLDIGIVPLVDSAFNRAKSGLKMLEYAALGVVPVGSPTPDNVRLEKHGLGFIAEKPKDWRKTISRLARDKELLAEWQTDVRTRASLFTYEHNAEQWWDVWTGVTQASSGRHVRSVQGSGQRSSSR